MTDSDVDIAPDGTGKLTYNGSEVVDLASAQIYSVRELRGIDQLFTHIPLPAEGYMLKKFSLYGPRTT